MKTLSLVLLPLVLAACGGAQANDAEESPCTDAGAMETSADASPIPVEAGLDAADGGADAPPVDPCAQTTETQIQCYGTDTSKWKASKPIACRDRGSATSAIGCVVTEVHADWSQAPAAVWCCQ